MSHFTVLVIAADTEAALQPFHEFECTGTNDQYVQDLDETEEKRSEYAADTEAVLFDQSGARHYLYTAEGNYDVRFCRDAKQEPFGHTRKEKMVPAGWTEGEVPASERRTFAQWLEHDGIKPLAADGTASDGQKFGYFVTDAAGEVVKVVRRTNPNKQWDWWQIGGRWSNKLLFKDGRRGNEGAAGEIDWDGMLAEHGTKAAALYDRVMAGIAGREVQSWAQVMKRRDAGEFDWDSARAFYNGQPIIEELKASKAIDDWNGAEELSGVLAAKDRQSYIDRQAKANASTWALLQDGHWNERGSMGWFGMSDATDGTVLDYSENYWLTIRALPADARVAVVDCHI